MENSETVSLSLTFQIKGGESSGFFGYFKGLPYERATESFDEYKKLHNDIPKEKVVKHIESLEEWLTSLPSEDIFTGEKLQAGLYQDGDFVFPLEFLHYYKKYEIGIPYEYENYLKKIITENH